MRQDSLIYRIVCTSFVLCSIVFLQSVSAHAASTKKSGTKETSRTTKDREYAVVCKKVEQLVKDYFPRAKFKSTKSGIHFEFKVKNYVASTGSSRRILAPNVDGIVGDLKVKQGRYSGTEVLPYKVNEMYWVSLKMAPYSKPKNNHLFTKLLYPPQTPIVFINDFIKIVQSYENNSSGVDSTSISESDSSDIKKQVPDNTKEASKLAKLIEENTLEDDKSNDNMAKNGDQEAKEIEVSKKSTDQESKEEEQEPKVASINPKKEDDLKPDTPVKSIDNAKVKGEELEKDKSGDSASKSKDTSSKPETPSPDGEEEEKFDFGAPKFSSYTFSEGRFKIKLPGSPRSKASNKGGMRFVDFKYVETQGLYNIGYAIMPAEVPYSEVNKFLNAMASSLISASGGKVESHHSLKWQGFPGRQIKIKNLDGKTSKSTLFRIFLARRYFYILQAAGSNAWLASPAVKTVLNSLVIKDEQTSSKRSRYRSRSYSSKSNYSYTGKSKRYSGSKRPRYNHKWEKIRADRKYNRVRYR